MRGRAPSGRCWRHTIWYPLGGDRMPGQRLRSQIRSLTLPLELLGLILRNLSFAYRPFSRRKLTLGAGKEELRPRSAGFSLHSVGEVLLFRSLKVLIRSSSFNHKDAQATLDYAGREL